MTLKLKNGELTKSAIKALEKLDPGCTRGMRVNEKLPRPYWMSREYIATLPKVG